MTTYQNDQDGGGNGDDEIRWDLLVLTARSAAQKDIFEQQLAQLLPNEEGEGGTSRKGGGGEIRNRRDNKFCKQTIVLEDRPENVRIGSGGATLNALDILASKFGGPRFIDHARVLLLHSGGLSQRIHHVALTGKAFMLMPDGRTLLEHKLECYRHLLRALCSVRPADSGFVFIASADVLEHFPAQFALSPAQGNAEVLLVAHQSPLEVAVQHGVYLVENDGKSLKKVLQKPCANLIRQLLPGKRKEEFDILTDSCYLVGARLVQKLVEMRRLKGDVLCELCCYRDFLCPLGTEPDEQAYFSHSKMDLKLREWHQILWSLMRGVTAVELIDLGPQSFFHFGTPAELLHHFLDKSAFRLKFLANLEGPGNIVHSVVEEPGNVSPSSFVEWSQLSGNVVVEENCILSGLCYFSADDDGQNKSITIPPGTCISTFPIGGRDIGMAYVTVAFHLEDDLKLSNCGSQSSPLRWFGHPIAWEGEGGDGPQTLWDYPLFVPHPSAQESLSATVRAIQGGFDPIGDGKGGTRRMAIGQVLLAANAKEMLKWREEIGNKEA